MNGILVLGKGDDGRSLETGRYLFLCFLMLQKLDL